MKDMKYADIVAANRKLKDGKNTKNFKIGVIGNVTVNPLKEILEYFLHPSVCADVDLGEYDAMVQDSQKYGTKDCVIIFWEMANLSSHFHYKHLLFEDSKTQDFVLHIKTQIDLVLQNLKNCPLVLFNSFHEGVFSENFAQNSVFSRVSNDLNQFLSYKTEKNLKLISLSNIYEGLSLSRAIDYRLFLRSQCPYTSDFFKDYSESVSPYIYAKSGKSKKLLILDADNTLWKGILGEDGHSGVEYSWETESGKVFCEVQHHYIDLFNKGIMLALCTKNNMTDVDELFVNAKHMPLKKEHFVAVQANWNPKSENIKKIAQDLNLGIDSFVFIDDSEFECASVKSAIPEVTCFTVPKLIAGYPSLVRKIKSLFYRLETTQEDLARNAMYTREKIRDNEKSKYQSTEDFLHALNLEVKITIAHQDNIPRIAQLTQKTNQFNLTTKRYTEHQIVQFKESVTHHVFSFSVSDKFGESGLTGVMILRSTDLEKNNNKTAIIDSFLISCRVLGRQIEHAFFDHIIGFLREKNYQYVVGEYIKTQKNAQVEDFYDRIGFTLVEKTPESKFYHLKIANYKEHKPNFIKVIHGY